MNVLILRIGAGVAAINDEVLDPPTPHRACDLIAGRIDSATTHRRPLAGLAAVQTGGRGDVTQGRRASGARARGACTRPAGCGRRRCGARSSQGRRPDSRRRCVLRPSPR
jgi:hypothetical protein